MLGDLETDELLSKMLSNLQDRIGKLLKDEMNYFANDLPDYVLEIVKYLFRQGGKRLRPALFVHLAEQINGNSQIGPFALAIELIHTMSLYHDDVIDTSNERRGAPTVHFKWDPATAIVGGDILHSLIHRHIIEAVDAGRISNQVAIDFLRELLEVEIEIGTTVLLEMKEAKSKAIPTVDEALQITAGKTAPLFGFSAKAAAIVTGINEIANDLYQFGYQFGLGFQLLDDLLDYFRTDKDMGGDLKEGKKTPIIVLISKRSPQLVDTYLGKDEITVSDIEFIRNKHQKEFEEIIRWIEDHMKNSKKVLQEIRIEMEELDLIFQFVDSKISFVKNYYSFKEN